MEELNADYEKGLSDAWECLKKVQNKDADELKEIFNLPFTKNAIDILVYLTPQEAIDKLKAWKEKHEIEAGDIIISNEGNKAVVQFITPNGEWGCFNKCTYFTLNKEKQKLWKKTGRHIDLTKIFKELEGEMFKTGDWVYGIDKYHDDNFLTYGMIIGDIGDYYVLYEQIDKCIAKNTTIKRIYSEYVENGETNVVMLEKECTFATEQEAREALGVIG